MNTDLFEIIRTTRAMRRLKPDPVPTPLIRQILEAGIAAPSGGNMQAWRFLVIRDPAVKASVAQWYRRGWHEIVGPRYRAGAPPPGSSRDRFDRMLAAAEHLADHLQDAPVWIVACLMGGTHSAPRARRSIGGPEHAAGGSGAGAGRYADDVVPAVREGGGGRFGAAGGRTFLCILPIGYPLGKFGPVARTKLEEVVFADRWGETWTDS